MVTVSTDEGYGEVCSEHRFVSPKEEEANEKLYAALDDWGVLSCPSEAGSRTEEYSPTAEFFFLSLIGWVPS
jgi:hypothetical protein